MNGDADVGQSFQKVLGRLDIDAEGILARYVGDSAARMAGNAARETRQWAKRSGKLGAENVADFLTEESELLVTPLAMNRFEESVHALRSDVDRLALRIKRLESLINQRSTSPHPGGETPQETH